MPRRRLALALWLEALLASAAALYPFAPQPGIARDNVASAAEGNCADIIGSPRQRDGVSAGFSKVSVTIGDDRSISIDLASAIATAKGCFWTGVVLETGEAAFLMIWNDGHLTGAICYRGKILSLTKADGTIRAVPEFEPRPTRTAHAFAGAHSFASRPGDGRSEYPATTLMTARGADAQDHSGATPFSDRLRAALEARKVIIDLMVLYTPRAADSYVLDMSNLIADAVEQVNASFRNSGVGNVSLRLVHTESIDYTETKLGHFDHLYRMVDGLGAFHRVGKLRNDKQADIVGLVVDDPSQCGLATRVAPDPEEAYFVVHHSCAALMFSIAHEIGHILGARHELQIDADNAPTSYAFGYVNGGEWRDIMSYAQSCGGCPRLPRWSNPRVQYQGRPTGTPTSDAARVILEQAGRVATFR
jgi:hypothetical protein